MQESIASGWASGCRRKLNGKKQLAAKTAGSGRGETIGRPTIATASGLPWRSNRYDRFPRRPPAFSSEYPPEVYGGLGTAVSEMTTALAGPVAFDLFLPAQGDYSRCPPTVSLKEVAISNGENNALLWLNYCKAAANMAAGSALDIDLLHCHDWITVPAGLKSRQVLNKPRVCNGHRDKLV